MLRRIIGLAFLTAGLAATVASSVFGSRASVAADAGFQIPTVLRALLMQLPRPPRRSRKRRARSMSKPSAPPEANLAKLLDGLQESELFKESEELAAVQAKAEKA